MHENLDRVIATQDAVLLGRRTYDEWAEFWPSSDIEPFASFINGVEKFVVTSTTPEETWAKSTVVDGGLVEFVTELKQQSGKDIGVHGSIALTQSLLEQDLVDELRLVIAPALHINGRKLCDKGPPRRLSLTRNITSPSDCLSCSNVESPADEARPGVSRARSRSGARTSTARGSSPAGTT